MAPVCVGSLFLGMAVLCVCLLGCCLPKNAPGELSILEVFPLQTEREGCDTVCFPLWACCSEHRKGLPGSVASLPISVTICLFAEK